MHTRCWRGDRRHGGVRPVEQGEGDSVVARSRGRRTRSPRRSELSARFRHAWPGGIELARPDRAAHRGGAAARRGQLLRRRAEPLRSAAGDRARRADAALAAVHDLVVERLPDGATLVDLGSHRLRDLGRPEHVFALAHPELAAMPGPLRSLDAVPNNLPDQLTSFVGRDGSSSRSRRAGGDPAADADRRGGLRKDPARGAGRGRRARALPRRRLVGRARAAGGPQRTVDVPPTRRRPAAARADLAAGRVAHLGGAGARSSSTTASTCWMPARGPPRRCCAAVRADGAGDQPGAARGGRRDRLARAVAVAAAARSAPSRCRHSRSPMPCGCSSSVPPRCARTSPSTPRTPPRSPRSVTTSMASRWRSSSPPHAFACSASSRSRPASAIGSAC